MSGAVTRLEVLYCLAVRVPGPPRGFRAEAVIAVSRGAVSERRQGTGRAASATVAVKRAIENAFFEGEVK